VVSPKKVKPLNLITTYLPPSAFPIFCYGTGILIRYRISGKTGSKGIS